MDYYNGGPGCLSVLHHVVWFIHWTGPHEEMVDSLGYLGGDCRLSGCCHSGGYHFVADIPCAAPTSCATHNFCPPWWDGLEAQERWAVHLTFSSWATEMVKGSLYTFGNVTNHLSMRLKKDQERCLLGRKDQHHWQETSLDSSVILRMADHLASILNMLNSIADVWTLICLSDLWKDVLSMDYQKYVLSIRTLYMTYLPHVVHMGLCCRGRNCKTILSPAPLFCDAAMLSWAAEA